MKKYGKSESSEIYHNPTYLPRHGTTNKMERSYYQRRLPIRADAVNIFPFAGIYEYILRCLFPDMFSGIILEEK